MNAVEQMLQRPALIAAIVKRAPRSFGRTALMKCLYFLDALRGVKLPYRFSLYTYGPFDAAVLDDLSYAEALNAVESRVIEYPGGSRYELRPGPKAAQVKSAASKFIAGNRHSIDWVIGEFGGRSASDLEMASTIVYVDREPPASRSRKRSLEEIVQLVHGVKPHLRIESIKQEGLRLKKKGLLRSVV